MVISRQARRNICFVTGTRAEFGLLIRTLERVRDHPMLRLQVVATGTHLDRSRGYSVAEIRKSGFKVNDIVAWPEAAQGSASRIAVATGNATAALAETFQKLKTDIVLVVGDRVEAFAAAAAGHISGLCVAHVHGGDRAPGVVDDSLRHAITKLAHVHFPATKTSAERLIKLGEDRWRVHRVGSPGIDGIEQDAAAAAAIAKHLGVALPPRRGALVALHPAGESAAVAFRRAGELLQAVSGTPFEWVVVVYPNNDPGASGIVRCWDSAQRSGARRGSTGSGVPQPMPPIFCRNLPRDIYLGVLCDAAVLIGNSSSGIIEAASFGTPVIDVGPRQEGREHGSNVVHVGYSETRIGSALKEIWNHGRPLRHPRRNPYGGANTSQKIAETLSKLKIDERLLRKLIAY
jgi:GDP/UDP-N,N'-diacetylbacillosamine 2-epimerase (hydrolysing)